MAYYRFFQGCFEDKKRCTVLAPCPCELLTKHLMTYWSLAVRISFHDSRSRRNPSLVLHLCGWPCGLVQKSATLILLWHSTVYLIRNLTILSLYYNSWNLLVKSKVSTLVHVCAFRGGSSIGTGWTRALTTVARSMEVLLTPKPPLQIGIHRSLKW
jgi:hypothetical protein